MAEWRPGQVHATWDQLQVPIGRRALPASQAGAAYTARRPRIQAMTSTATDPSATTVKRSVTAPTVFISIIQSNGCDGVSEYRTGSPPLFNHCHISILDAPQLSSAREHSTNDTIKRRRRGRTMRDTTQVDHAIETRLLRDPHRSSRAGEGEYSPRPSAWWRADTVSM